MHPEVTKQDYKSFAERYYQSEEEATDLIEFYNANDGNIKKILEFIMCSRNEDVPRYIAFYESKIKDKVIENFPAFKKSKIAVELIADERVEAKAEKNKLKK